jgi:CRP/FNR family transcriptional regulator, anaerobic regulatory protein
MGGNEPPNTRQNMPPWYGELIQHYPVLKTLPAKLARDLRGQGGPVSLPAGTIAFDEDCRCSGLVLITRGSVRVVRSGPQGREIMLYRVRPGESCILSVSCLLGRTSFAARGIVEADLTGVNLPGALFEKLVSESPAFRMFIFELFGSRVSALLQLVEQVAFHRLDRRLAVLLLQRFEQAGIREIETTHQELADQIGSLREIVSRILESFEAEGSVALARGRVTILDPDFQRGIALAPSN